MAAIIALFDSRPEAERLVSQLYAEIPIDSLSYLSSEIGHTSALADQSERIELSLPQLGFINEQSDMYQSEMAKGKTAVLFTCSDPSAALIALQTLGVHTYFMA
ncbi:hypothetical protein LOK74_13715 [Brevibacillus humidisoli]|uniref:hypothetical protein n=1 Tax=Brevibacillus humidisoli TaxID=2895522 RepID=UPI001E3268D1|nr:hypothetical protein [Brevibacillus humidisoli]UFJ39128.1 hypothetical protein LOK74_13715 [Brevibacillus humidisoli]